MVGGSFGATLVVDFLLGGIWGVGARHCDRIGLDRMRNVLFGWMWMYGCTATARRDETARLAGIWLPKCVGKG